MKKQSLVELLFTGGKSNKILNSFYPKNSLSSEIFDDNEKINDEIRKQLLSISDNFLDFLGVDFFVHDIVLTGSLASYGWSEYSDVDLHIILDYDESKHNNELLSQFFEAKKDSWNETHNIQIKNYDVELYVQDIKEDHTASGVYSLLNHKWVIKPAPTKVDIDENKIINKSNEYMKNIDNLISKFENGEDVLSQVKKIKDKLKKFRKTGLSQDGEYSYENLTFKYLRRNGYIKKLIDLKTKITDKELSIKQ